MLTSVGKLTVPQRYLPFLGAGAAVAATLAYILWGPDSNRSGFNTGSSKRKKVAGLENLGNTCYLNTILQSLAACPAFVKWLSRALRQGFFKGKHNELAYKLSKTLEVVNDHSVSYSGSQVYSPHEVLHALYNCSWKADRGQQDAHELFQFLLSVLGEEKESIPSPVPLCDASRLIEPGRSGSASLHSDLHSNIEASLPKVTNRDWESPFRGLLANHLSCTVCGHRNPVTYSSFDCLTLPIPAVAFSTLSLEHILAKFTQRELVHDVECTECSKQLEGRTAAPSSKAVKSLSAPVVRGITPPTPKKVPKASVSKPAPSTIPATPPSGKAPPTLQVTPPSLPTTEAGSPSALDTNFPSSVATPTIGPATPISDQRVEISLSENRLSQENLHRRTAPSAKSSPDRPSAGCHTETSGPQMRRETDDRLDASPGVSEQNGVDLVSNSYRGNGQVVQNTLSGPVAQTHKFQEQTNSRAMEEGINACNGTSEMTGSDQINECPRETSQNICGHGLRDLHKERLQDDEEAFEGRYNGTSDVTTLQKVQSTEESHTPCVNGADQGLTVGALNSVSSPTLHSLTESEVDHRLSPSTSELLPNPNGRHGTYQRVPESPRHDCSSKSPEEEHKDGDGATVRQVSNSKVAPPKCHSTPKHRPLPLRVASSPTNHSSIPEDTPARSPSIFGRIPGTDGIKITPPTSESLGGSGNDDSNADASPKCRRMFWKQLTLGKLPQCLCIHLQRVTWLADGLPSRREEHVLFPEYLDMSPYRQTAAMSSTTQIEAKLQRLISEDESMPVDTPQSRKSSRGFIGGNFLTDHASMSLVGGSLTQMSPRISHHSAGMSEKDSSGAKGTAGDRDDSTSSEASLRATEARYRLASAVVHQGDAYTGHFLTFRRVPSVGNEPLSDSWLCVSDESVYASTAKEVFSQKAYMLYYQRM